MGTLQKYTPQQLFKSDLVLKKFEKVLGENSRGFVTSVLQILNDSKMLQGASSESVLNAAMTAASLDLPVNPSLGRAYIIPYKNKGGTVAQFQIGYKGYIELAIRSGMYKTIASSEIYEGQLVSSNPLTGYEFNFDVKSGDEIIGYAAFIKLTTGFEKTFYMSREEVEDHAKKYSQSYKKGYGVWADDFDTMAKKTVLKLLISKYGPLSIDPQMQKALEVDQSEIKDPNSFEVDYLDNPNEQSPEQQVKGRTPIDIDNQRQSLDEQAKGTVFEGS